MTTAHTRRARPPALVAAAAIALLTAAVYLALPEHVYFFDGVSFAGGIEYALQNPGTPEILFRFPKHYLYIPAIYGLARALAWLVPPDALDAYRLMQVVAGCMAGVLNGVLYLFLRRWIASLGVSLALLILFAFSNIHWERALEGQSYFAGHFWAILALLAFAWHDRPPSRGTLGLMALFTALGGLFHVSNIIVAAPIALAWLWRDGRRAVKPLGGYLLAASVLTGLAPAIHYRLWDPSQFRRLFLASVNDTEFFRSGFFMVPTLQSLWERSVQVFAEFLVPLRGGGWSMAAGLALTALFALLLGLGLPRPWGASVPAVRKKTPGILVPLGTATFVTWAAFFSVATPGYLFHWELAYFGLWLLLVAGCAAPVNEAGGGGSATVRWAGGASLGALPAALLAVLAITVPSFNLAQKYWPISRPDHNRDALAAERLGEMIPPSEPLFLLGAGAGDNNLKAYMIHFGGRGWLAADIIMMDTPGQRRCGAFAQEIRSRLRERGVAFLSTTLLDRSSRARVAARYGCSDPDGLLPLEAMRCLVLDPTPGVGLVLARGDHADALASLAEHYRDRGQAGLAERVDDPTAFAPCR